VSASQIQIVTAYIAHQKEHHKKQTFQDEFRQFLKLNGIQYDEKYVWD
jgi:putative transposase